SIRLSSGFREPRGILLGIAPAYIPDRRIIFSGRHEPACFCGSGFIPFPYRNREFADRERLDRYLMNRPFRNFFIATHREASAPERAHFGLSDRRRLHLRRGRRRDGRRGLRERRCLFRRGRGRGRGVGLGLCLLLGGGRGGGGVGRW